MLMSGLIALLSSCQTAGDTRSVTPAADLPRLASDLAPLKHWFARAGGHPRALALLSPT